MSYTPNYLSLIIGIALIALVFLKSNLFNIGVAAFLVFFSFWVLFVYINDLQHVHIWTSKTYQFVATGSLFVITNFTMAICMGIPFFKAQIDFSEQLAFHPQHFCQQNKKI